MTYTSCPRALLFNFTKIFSLGNWMTSRGLSRWSKYSAIFCARSGEPEPAYNLISPYIFISCRCCGILAPCVTLHHLFSVLHENRSAGVDHIPVLGLPLILRDL